MFRMTASKLGVTVGSYHVYEEDSGQRDIAVSRVNLHPQYSSWTIENDICILELAEEADLSQPNIGAASLPEAGDQPVPGSVCWVCGWGTTSEGGSHASVLLKVDVIIFSPEQCFLAYDGVGITEGMLCAGNSEGGKGFCQGDSGGSLMCPSQHGDQLDLTGIVSWSYGCAQPDYPGVYTDITYFLSWITDNM